MSTDNSLSLHEARKLESAVGNYIDDLVRQRRRSLSFPVTIAPEEVVREIQEAHDRELKLKGQLLDLIQIRYTLRHLIRKAGEESGVETLLLEIARDRATMLALKNFHAPLSEFEDTIQLSPLTAEMVQLELNAAATKGQASRLKFATFPDNETVNTVTRKEISGYEKNIARKEAEVGALNHTTRLELTDFDMALLRQAQLV